MGGPLALLSGAKSVGRLIWFFLAYVCTNEQVIIPEKLALDQLLGISQDIEYNDASLFSNRKELTRF